MDRKGLPRCPADLPTTTAMLLALAAAKQASSATSMAQARLGATAAPRPAATPSRVALFSASARGGVRGSFAPEAAGLINDEGA